MSQQTKTVEEFFAACNWEGRPFKNTQPLILEPTRPLCLTVRAFFESSNWHGKPKTLTTEAVEESENLITLKVKEFFAYMTWEGKPKIASIPKATPIVQATELSNPQMNLDDLSDLF